MQPKPHRVSARASSKTSKTIGRREMSLHALTIGRRGRLGHALQAARKRIDAHLALSATYEQKVTAAVALTTDETRLHLSTQLVALIAAIEAFVIDTTGELLVCFPGKIRDKNVALDDFASRGSITDLIQERARAQLNSAAYGTFPKFVEQCVDIFGASLSASGATLVARLNEAKSTRDIFIHAGGVANEIYVRKAGSLARARPDEALPLDDAYLSSVRDIVMAFADLFEAIGPSKFYSYKKARAFREMWESTALQLRVPFEKAWSIEHDDMVRPKEAIRAWSISEQMLYDFFLGIYGSQNVKSPQEFTQMARRWPGDSPEGLVIRSWLEDPFDF
jgi:hypothetical protein